MKSPTNLPREIDGGAWSGGHVQGVALDTERKYIYYSYTTLLVKADLSGRVIGTVTGLKGHLGCLAFNDADRRVYGSLELKHDSIGKGIMKTTGATIAEEDSFYVAIFDVDKIDCIGLDAERDQIMTAVYLGEVVRDYSSADPDGLPHRYGCSGIDGISFGPVFGTAKNSPKMLMVAYGIYGEPNRAGNDHQVILQYDWRGFERYEQPLIQGCPHHSGPEAGNKYFLYTGNTNWGIQNLEYDAFIGDWYVAVYVGNKPEYPNFPMYIIDGSAPPHMGELKGRGGERGLLLSLLPEGVYHEASGIWGITYPKGQTGMISLGDGYFYMSYSGRTPPPEKLHTCTVRLCRRLPGDPVGFEVVE